MASPSQDPDRTKASPPLDRAKSSDRLAGLASTTASPGPEDLPAEVRAAAMDPERRVGRYVILADLGRGGMGAVFRAYDTKIRREVAIKMLHVADAEPGEVERFAREASTAGRLRHEGIAALLEVGEHRGRPYLVMELVPGESLESRLRRAPLSPREAAAIVREVALALEHAHENGIVHRDVKPANILLDAASKPRLVDFGLARDLRSLSRLTKTGVVVGTPSYLSPEQTGESSRTHGPSCDIYALGGVLYRALAGRPPFEASALPALLKQIVVDRPTPPRKLVPGVPRELEAIALRCLEKKPEDRFPSAAGVARALESFLEGSPENASRRPLGLVALGIFTLVNLALFLAYALRETPGEGSGAPGTTTPAPSTARPPATTSPFSPSKPIPPNCAELRLSPRGRLRLAGAIGSYDWKAYPFSHAALSPDGTRGFMGGDKGVLTVVELPSGRLVRAWRAHRRAVSAVALSPDGKLGLSAGEESEKEWSVRLWDAATGKEVRALGRHAARVNAVSFSPDGKRGLSASDDGTIALHDLKRQGGDPVLLGTNGKNGAGAFLGNDRLVTGRGKDLLVWDVSDESNPRNEKIGEHPDAIRCVAVSPDGKLVASAGDGSHLPAYQDTHGGALRVTDVASHDVTPFDTEKRRAESVAFVADGTNRVVSGSSNDGHITLWDKDGRELRDMTFACGWYGGVASVCPSRDGKHVFASSAASVLGYYRLDTGEKLSRPIAPEGMWNAVSVSRDRKRVLAGANEDGMVRLYDLASGRELASWKGEAWIRGVALSQDGALGFAGDAGAWLRVLDLAQKAEKRLLHVADRDRLSWALPSPDFTKALAGMENGKLLLADLTRSGGKPEEVPSCGSTWARPAWSPDGRRALVAGQGKRIVLLDVEQRAVVRDLEPSENETPRLAFLGNDRAVGADSRGTLSTWTIEDGKTASRILLHDREVLQVASSDDGERAVTASQDGTVAYLDASARDAPPSELDRLDLATAGDVPVSVAFVPSSHAFVVGTERGVILHFEAVEK